MQKPGVSCSAPCEAEDRLDRDAPHGLADCHSGSQVLLLPLRATTAERSHVVVPPAQQALDPDAPKPQAPHADCASPRSVCSTVTHLSSDPTSPQTSPALKGEPILCKKDLSGSSCPLAVGPPGPVMPPLDDASASSNGFGMGPGLVACSSGLGRAAALIAASNAPAKPSCSLYIPLERPVYSRQLLCRGLTTLLVPMVVAAWQTQCVIKYVPGRGVGSRVAVHIPPPPPQGMPLEGKGPRRWPQKRLGRWLEEVAEAVEGGYCRLQLPLRLAFAVREQWLDVG